MKHPNLIALLLALCCCLPLEAQWRNPADTAGRRPVPATGFRATQLIAPGVLIGSGLGIHYLAHDSWDLAVKNKAQEINAKYPLPRVDDFVQYAPLVMNLGLVWTGVPSRYDFWDIFIETALAHAVCGIISGPSKALFHTLRPNEANYQSFPSGHSSFAFTGAELVRINYGWGWGGGAYAVATYVGMSRIWRNWHWLSDVLFGAGIGILSAQAGRWLLEPVKSLLGLREFRRGMAVVPSWDPYSGSLGLSFACTF